MRGKVFQYFFQRCLRLLQYFVVPEPQYLESLTFQLRRTQGIVFFVFLVLASVCLDNQPAFDANEIHDISGDRHLPAKFPPPRRRSRR